MADTRFDMLVKRDEQLRSQRAPWESHWQELRDLVNPSAQDFTRTTSQGQRRTDKILDGTAPWALEQLSGGLHSFLTSPSDRWFSLCVKDYDYMKDYQALSWLERVSDLIFEYYADPRSNSNSSLHEIYQDLGSFGTAVEYQEWDRKQRCIVFRAYPLASCRILESSKGMVDTLYRDTEMSTRQIEQEFPNHTIKKIKEEKNQDKMWVVVHAVFPRTDRDAQKLNSTNKKFASFYFCKEGGGILSEGGYDEFPYHVARWSKRAGETYGRSPGMTCLPDIKMVNAMEKVQIRAVQKIVDPPLLTPSDGFMLPIDTRPGSLIFFDSTSIQDAQMMRPLETKGRVEIGEDKLEQKRNHIMRCFYADWITRMKKKERQTATEVMDERDEMLQMMAPIMGRLQAELLGPRIRRTFNLLLDADLIPPAPTSMNYKTLHLEYISPAAKAQMASKGMNIRRFTEELVPLVQLAPEIMDILDTDALAEEMALIQDVSRKVLRSPDDVKKIREARQKQQQATAMAQNAQPVASAMKDMATAQEKGLDLSNMQLPTQ